MQSLIPPLFLMSLECLCQLLSVLIMSAAEADVQNGQIIPDCGPLEACGADFHIIFRCALL